MKKIRVVYHSGYDHGNTQANGRVGGIETVDDLSANLIAIETAAAFGVRVAAVVRDLVR